MYIRFRRLFYTIYCNNVDCMNVFEVSVDNCQQFSLFYMLHVRGKCTSLMFFFFLIIYVQVRARDAHCPEYRNFNARKKQVN